MKADACFTSNTGLWETPQYLFNALDARFHFGLDACAIPENAKCENFFTPKDDALKQNWGGTEQFGAILHTAKAWVSG